MFKHIGIYLVSMLLFGCAVVDSLEQQHTKISTELADTESHLVTKLEQLCQVDHKKLALAISSLITLEQPQPLLNTRQSKADDELAYAEACTPIPEKSRIKIDHKLVLGQIEKVMLTKEMRSFDARIDTGAVTSSLGVYNLSRFERDGKKWVVFSLDKDKKSPTYQYPIKRIIRIALSSINKINRRVVIQLNFKLGGQSYNSEFSLADRRHLDYQVLIGREFLLDRAVVDVSARYLTKQE